MCPRRRAWRPRGAAGGRGEWVVGAARPVGQAEQGEGGEAGQHPGGPFLSWGHGGGGRVTTWRIRSLLRPPKVVPSSARVAPALRAATRAARRSGVHLRAWWGGRMREPLAERACVCSTAPPGRHVLHP